MVSIFPEIARKGMGKLCGRGYRCISLATAVDSLRRRTCFPGRSFAITFDDGYESVYKQAFPLLQLHSLTATVFLTIGDGEGARAEGRLPSMQGRDMLTWAQIREMHRWGIAFGAHTLTHPDLTRLPLDQVRSQICHSKRLIEDALGTRVASFAYPYGRYDRKVREVAEQNFDCACSDKLGLVRLSSDLYALERVDAYCLRKDWGFDLMSSRLLPWYLRIYRVLRWGRMKINARRP